MGEGKPTKKRPRDILASLDAAFSSSASKPASKYTTQAAQQSNAAAALQAYQHNTHKKKKKKQQHQHVKQPPTTQPHEANKKLSEPYDPLYGRLDVDTLRVGLKNCSLSANVASLRKANVLHATLRQYIGAFAKDGTSLAMTDKLKNKVLQFDNPVRTTDAAKQRAVNDAQAQASKLLSARQRRQLGMHMLQANAIDYSEAEKLCEIWRRYARDVIGSDFVGDHNDAATRSTRLQAKLRNIDLSGCPIEVIKARNPLNVGIVGIIIADKTQVIQVCVSGRSKVITLPKQELCLRVPLDDDKSFFMEGRWLLRRRMPNE